ncbi:MAG: hypothetical protein WCT52_01215 [Candidatus Micrarchaeia archaeon]
MATVLASAPRATAIQTKDIGPIAWAFWLKANKFDLAPDAGRSEIGVPLQIFNRLARDIFAEENKSEPACKENAARLEYPADYGIKAANAVEARAASYFDEFERKVIGCIYSAFENESKALLAGLGKKFDYPLESIDLPKRVPYKTAMDGLFRHYSKREMAAANGEEVDRIEAAENIAYAPEKLLVGRVMDNWKYNILEKDGEDSVKGNTGGLLYLPAVSDETIESPGDKKLMPYPGDGLLDFWHGRRVFDAAVRNLRREIPEFFRLLTNSIEDTVRAVFRKELSLAKTEP